MLGALKVNEQKKTTESQRRPIRCIVVSDKMTKSRVAVLERLVKHPVVGKYMKRSTRLMFHDETNETHEGDVVLIKPCRPMSARKKFELVSVLRKRKGT
jgi:small subunit ribosomal protein S17